MTDTEIRDVSDTALWVAAYRAKESARPDAKFHDPMASVLIGERGRAIGETMPGASMMEWVMVLRTIAIDRLIMNAINSGADMVVNLGAGLDTRPYRLDLPTTMKWIEVDFPNIIALKNERLKDHAPKCELQRISLDITQPESRQKLKALTASAQSVVVVSEGLLMYLEPQLVNDLADDLRRMGNVHYWIQDFYSGKMRGGRMSPWRKRLKAAPFKFQPADWVEFFTARQWQIAERIRLIDEAQQLGRRPPFSKWRMLMFMLMPPHIRKRMQERAGYVMFKPVK